MSFYELQMIDALIWLSATIHLGTIMVLREYLYDHKLVRGLKIFGIVILLCFLCFTKGLLTAGYSRFFKDDTPVKCILAPEIRHSSFISRAGGFNILDLFPLVYILSQYVGSMCALFENPQGIESMPRAVSFILWIEAASKRLRAKKMTEDKCRVTISTIQHQFLIRH